MGIWSVQCVVGVVIVLVCVVGVVIALLCVWKCSRESLRRYLCCCVSGGPKNVVHSMQQENQRLRHELSQHKVSLSGRFQPGQLSEWAGTMSEWAGTINEWVGTMEQVGGDNGASGRGQWREWEGTMEGVGGDNGGSGRGQYIYIYIYI